MKEIRVGLVGCGYIGGVHYDSIGKLTGARVAAVCSPDADMLEAFTSKHPVERTFADHRSML